MPIPIIIWVAGAAAVAAAGGIQWRKIKKLKKKKILVLGDKAVGKTTFVQWLEHGKIPVDQLSSTSAPDDKDINFRKKPHLKQLSSLKLSVTEVLDVPGGEDWKSTWREKFMDVDFVIYFLNTEKIYFRDEKAIKRINHDGEAVSIWYEILLKEKKRLPKVVVVGNFLDKLAEHHDLAAPDNGSLRDKLRYSDGPRNFFDHNNTEHLHTDAFVIGSLKSDEDAQLLVATVLDKLASIE